MVYIRIEADISALTYPNKRQAVCYPASTGGGAEEEEIKEEGRIKREWRGEYVGLKQTGMRGSVPTMQSSSHLFLSQSQRGKTAVSIQG